MTESGPELWGERVADVYDEWLAFVVELAKGHPFSDWAKLRIRLVEQLEGRSFSSRTPSRCRVS